MTLNLHGTHCYYMTIPMCGWPQFHNTPIEPAGPPDAAEEAWLASTDFGDDALDDTPDQEMYGLEPCPQCEKRLIDPQDGICPQCETENLYYDGFLSGYMAGEY